METGGIGGHTGSGHWAAIYRPGENAVSTASFLSWYHYRPHWQMMNPDLERSPAHERELHTPTYLGFQIFVCLSVWDMASLYSSSWLGTFCVDKSDLKIRDRPASASQVRDYRCAPSHLAIALVLEHFALVSNGLALGLLQYCLKETLLLGWKTLCISCSSNQSAKPSDHYPSWVACSQSEAGPIFVFRSTQLQILSLIQLELGMYKLSRPGSNPISSFLPFLFIY